MPGDWSRLRTKRPASIWSLGSPYSSHVGNAGVGVVSMRGAPVALPSFATAQLRRSFDCGRLLPLGSARFMHLVVLYGYQGTDCDAEQLALTEQLLDAAMGELGAVARGEPCLKVGDFNVEPTKVPCLFQAITAGLWVDLEEAAWAVARSSQPAVTCERCWESSGGDRRDFVADCPFDFCCGSFLLGGLE